MTMLSAVQHTQHGMHRRDTRICWLNSPHPPLIARRVPHSCTDASRYSVLYVGTRTVTCTTKCLLLLLLQVLGILSLFFMPVPLLLKQCYTVWVGICVAYIFTHIPEWTSWMLLVIMALYDLAAVLMPGGPLKILVELAIERQQELPALIYESRPVGRPYQRGMWRRGQEQQQPSSSGGAAAPVGSAAAAAATALVGLGGVNASDGSHSPVASHVALLAGQTRSADASLQELAVSSGTSGNSLANRRSRTAVPLAEGVEDSDTCAMQQGLLEQQQQQSTLVATAAAGRGVAAVGDQGIGSSSSVSGVSGPSRWVRVLGSGPLGEAKEGADIAGGQQAAAAASRSSSRSTRAVTPGPEQHQVVDIPAAGGAGAVGPEQQPDSEEEFEMPDGIKLGLGDFIFYSMLVGRAAMYDLMTVYASYIAVISGLGITLMLLALYRKALPALPVSIALGVLFYFLTRLVMEPFVVPLSLNLAYY
eukprot:GHUV01035841.1.p1 GENE.GHUV01035841.1~~GHUV01035841.1.p1  ORF type:complete len:476 (+),score=147.97 GHUV01035841.1:204-1631(+)